MKLWISEISVSATGLAGRGREGLVFDVLGDTRVPFLALVLARKLNTSLDSAHGEGLMSLEVFCLSIHADCGGVHSVTRPGVSV